MDGMMRFPKRRSGAIAPRLGGPVTPATTGTTTGTGTGYGYPWVDGDILYAADLDAAIAYSASFYSIAGFGAKSDGVTDDTAALNAAIAAALAGPLGGSLVIPAGKTVLANSISAVIPAGKTLSLNGQGPGLSELYFSSLTDGLNFQLATTAGIHIHGLSIIRGPTSPPIANTGLNIAVQSGPMYAGASSLRDLVITGSQTAQQVNQWQNSLFLSGVSNISIDNVALTGINGKSTDQGDALCVLQGGPGANQFGVSYNVVNCVWIGGSAGVDVRGYVQGVFIDNSTIIGQYDSVRWVGGGSYSAEELAVSNCTLNGAHRGFLVNQVNQCAVNNTTILRFNVGAATFAGVELNNSGFCSIANNNIIGTLSGTETGVLLTACGNYTNTVTGNITGNLNGAGIWMEGNTVVTTVVGNNLTGGTGIIQDTSGNLIRANMWNKYVVPDSPYLEVFGNVFTTGQTVYQSSASTIYTSQNRWFAGNDGSSETGSNAGSNYELVAASDTGTILGSPFFISRATGWATFSAYASTDLHVTLNGGTGTSRVFQFETGGVPRWFVGASNTAESGSNAGSDFEFIGISDSGTIIGAALTIKRSTGALTIILPVNAANDAAASSAGVPIGGIYRNGSALMVRAS